MKELCIILIIFISSCNQTNRNTTTDSNAVMQADKDFSALSQRHGMRYAFLQYIDTTCVLLRANHNPLKRVRAEQFIENINDSSFTLSWDPDTAIISKGGELAYTYGTYHLEPKDTSAPEDGTYVTIWKKQNDGSWKFVLDSGNPGLSKK